MQGLAVNRNVFVQNYQFHRQSFHAPVGVGLNKLAYQLNFVGVADPQEDERGVTRNAIAPKAALAATVIEQRAGGGAVGGIGVDQRAGQAAIKLRLDFGGVEMA